MWILDPLNLSVLVVVDTRAVLALYKVIVKVSLCRAWYESQICRTRKESKRYGKNESICQGKTGTRRCRIH